MTSLERHVENRLREAGATLLAIPGKDCLPDGMAARWPDAVHEIVQIYSVGWRRLRPSIPEPIEIIAMDEAWRWLVLLPPGRGSRLAHRILLLRAMVDPVTDQHRFSFRAIGIMVGLDESSIRRAHGKAIRAIADAIRSEGDIDVLAA